MRWCPARDSNPQYLASKASAFAVSPAGRTTGGPAQIRTENFALLRRTRLPVTPQAPTYRSRSRNRKVVWVAGFEPAASAFQARPSTGLTLHPEMVGRGRAAFMGAILSLALTACATVEQRPPEVRTQVISVSVPLPVPCFSEEERPRLPEPSPINIDTATVDQMAAALAADDIADQLFARAVDQLFILCMKRIADGTATQPVGK